MQDRWVSYIYRYKEQRKCENAGYVKVIRTSKGEASEARFDIGLKLCKPLISRCRVYFIYDQRELRLMEEVLIKPEERDVIRLKKTLPWMDFLKEGRTPKDFDGIFFAVDDGDTLMSIWSDREIKIEQLQVGDTAVEYNEATSDNSVHSGVVYNEAASGNTVHTGVVYNEAASGNTAHKEVDKQNLETENLPKGSASYQYEEDSNSIESKYNVTEIENTTAESLESENPIEYMLKNSIRLPQFIDSPFTECVKIVPQDIGRLPMSNWRLGQNSFLTHGYYRYKYIMLGKVRLGDKETYVIGVPGVFTNKEKYLANMFGFALFIPVKKADVKTGSFGYWVWEVTR